MYGITLGSGSGSGYWGVQCFEDLETGWRKTAYFARLFAEAHAETLCFYEVLGSGGPTCAKQRILRGFLHGCMQKHRVFMRFLSLRGSKWIPGRPLEPPGPLKSNEFNGTRNLCFAKNK